MAKYRFVYDDPYEFDGNLAWYKTKLEFDAANDKTAREVADSVLAEGTVIFDKSRYRQPIELVRIISSGNNVSGADNQQGSRKRESEASRPPKAAS